MGGVRILDCVGEGLCGRREGLTVLLGIPLLVAAGWRVVYFFLKEFLDAGPALRRHVVSKAAFAPSSLYNHALAMRQSRFTVRTETPRIALISGSLMPAK